MTEAMERALAPGGPWEGHRFVPLDSETSFRKGWENATKAYNALINLAETQPVSGLLHEDLAPVGVGEPEAAEQGAEPDSAEARERPKPPARARHGKVSR